MRIAQISADFAPNIGGVASHVIELGQAQAQLGEEVHVVTRPLGEMRSKKELWQGMTVYRPNLPRPKPFYDWMLARWLRGFYATVKPDIIHVHGLRPLKATRNLPCPVLFTNHTSGYLMKIEKGQKERDRLARQLAHISHVLAPSQELCDATALVGYQGPIDFIPNGVDTDRFAPGESPIREELGISEEEVIVLLARRLVEKNGVTVFAEAVAALKELPVRLLFAGDGEERSKVEQILRDNGMFDQSIFLGGVPNPQMPDVYRAADISVLPSFMEATSITGLESMACGIPLVGTTVGGIPTLINDRETGLLVPPGDPATLGKTLAQLARDPELRQQMGTAARSRAEEKFSWRGIASRTLDIYQQHLDSHS
ncbi:MAG: glycosyltransferase family 4 protein [Candidatus Sedimenticola sp. (ex Thyasira tokunagai)]